MNIDFQMAKICITGANGYLGRSLIPFLKQCNKCIAFDRQSFEKFSTYSSTSYNNFDFLVHAASPLRNNSNINYKLEFENISKFLETFSTLNPQCKVINISTVSVYFQSGSIFENSPILLNDHYTDGKFMIETKISSLFENNINLRVPAIVGRGASLNFIMKCFEANQTGKPIDLVNPNHFFNSFVTLNDLINVIIQLVKSKQSIPTNILNVSYDNPLLKENLKYYFPNTKFNCISNSTPEFVYKSYYRETLKKCFYRDDAAKSLRTLVGD